MVAGMNEDTVLEDTQKKDEASQKLIIGQGVDSDNIERTFYSSFRSVDVSVGCVEDDEEWAFVRGYN